MCRALRPHSVSPHSGQPRQRVSAVFGRHLPPQRVRWAWLGSRLTRWVHLQHGQARGQQATLWRIGRQHKQNASSLFRLLGLAFFLATRSPAAVCSVRKTGVQDARCQRARVEQRQGCGLLTVCPLLRFGKMEKHRGEKHTSEKPVFMEKARNRAAAGWRWRKDKNRCAAHRAEPVGRCQTGITHGAAASSGCGVSREAGIRSPPLRWVALPAASVTPLAFSAP